MLFSALLSVLVWLHFLNTSQNISTSEVLGVTTTNVVEVGPVSKLFKKITCNFVDFPDCDKTVFTIPVAGIDGRNGIDGIDGKNGRDGLLGLSGERGETGEKGDSKNSNSAIGVSGGGLAYDLLTGVISLPQATSLNSGYLSVADWNMFNAKMDLILDTDSLDEGGTNLYFTNTRVDDRIDLAIGSKNADNFNEGGINKYYTDAKVKTALLTNLLSTGQIVLGAANGTLSSMEVGSSGQVLMSNGPGNSPIWKNVDTSPNLASLKVAVGNTDILRTYYDLTDLTFDQQRVVVGGGTSGYPEWRGNRDQFTVFGRLNYTWNMFSQDFLRREGVAAVTNDTAAWDATFDDATGGGVSTGWSMDIANTGSGWAVLGIQSTAANTNAWWGTGGVTVTERSFNPVMEARVQAVGSSVANSMRSVVGFYNAAIGSVFNADISTSTNEAFFRKSGIGNTWSAVTRRGGLETITPLSSLVTEMSVLRIEMQDVGASGIVKFFVNGNLMVGHSGATVPDRNTRMGWGVGVGIGSSAVPLNTIGMVLDYVKIWSDDAPGSDSATENVLGESIVARTEEYREEIQAMLATPSDEITDTELKASSFWSYIALKFEKIIMNVAVVFKERVTFEDKDMAGRAVIGKGATHVEVKFDKAYDFEPVVVASSDEFASYKVSDVSSSGFKISLLESQEKDIKFNWIAIQVVDTKTQNSEEVVAGVATESASE